jgi:hypothetical protein
MSNPLPIVREVLRVLNKNEKGTQPYNIHNDYGRKIKHRTVTEREEIKDAASRYLCYYLHEE